VAVEAQYPEVADEVVAPVTIDVVYRKKRSAQHRVRLSPSAFSALPFCLFI
jgi:hypothetical protein